MMNRNYWLDGIMGLVAGDALGCPVQFHSREEIALNPVRGMRGHGTFDMPAGTWTDDSSMALAALVSILEHGSIDPDDIMAKFISWKNDGAYTPFGFAFDEGATCTYAIWNYQIGHDWRTCGKTGEHANGNGALMRILPVCLYCYEKQQAGQMSDTEVIEKVHQIAGLTHNHLRSHIACGLYYFMIRAILNREGSLLNRLQEGIDDGFGFYEKDALNHEQLEYYKRIRNITDFIKTPSKEIRSSGYVVASMEAALWSLGNTRSFADALLTAVNLGDDSDTVAAIAGGLAGLYYGYEGIPAEWLDVIQRREWIEQLCRRI